ncbi:MAG: hypothetical protein E7604_06710 [Ruminococcaceae bacterium]|nr:hypothetical protein [Oscillospiraceae bacterium]
MELHLLLISAVIAVVCTCPYLVSAAKRGAYRGNNEIIIEEAKRAGRVAVGTLVGTRYLPGEPGHKNPLDRDSRWLGTYTYEVNGKTYTLGVSTTDTLPETLTVYYPEGRPNKGITEMNASANGKQALIALIPVFVWAAVYWLLCALT